jgi:two-component sensor histidine kinase
MYKSPNSIEEFAHGQLFVREMALNNEFASAISGTVWLHSERCWQLGMILYELVTNVARHAFFEGRDGEVRVELSRAGPFARCGVSDNGSSAAGARTGRGLKIIGDLANCLGGQVGYALGANGSSFTPALPFVGKEQQANRCRAAYQHRVRAHGGLASCAAIDRSSSSR